MTLFSGDAARQDSFGAVLVTSTKAWIQLVGETIILLSGDAVKLLPFRRATYLPSPLSLAYLGTFRRYRV